MAKVKVKCICKACGAEFVVVRDCHSNDEENTREWIQNNHTFCNSCYAEAMLNHKLESDAKKGYAILKGSDKQIRWALEIRDAVLSCMDRASFDLGDEIKTDDAKPIGLGHYYTKSEYTTLRNRLISCDSAKYWIDTRTKTNILEILKDEAARMLVEEEVKITADESDDYVVKSDDASKDGIVHIQMMPEKTLFKYPYDKDFVECMHDHECAWDGEVWAKVYTDRTPSMDDLVADIGADLVNRGFVVAFPTKITMDKAVNGEYEKEHYRWITVSGKDGWLAVKIPYGKRKLYDAVRKIKGSKRDSDSRDVLVKAEFRDSIIGICEEYDFRVTPAAQELLDAQVDKATRVTIKPVSEVKVDKLKKDQTIIDDLLEDDD